MAPRALPFLIVGNPENRRVGLFQEALRAEGLAPATVVPWLALARDAGALEALPDEPALLRIDSFGESWEVERALCARGEVDARAEGVSVVGVREIGAMAEDRGRILAPRQQHLGFLRVLADLEAVIATKRRWRVLNPPAAIAELFDKRLTSRRYAGLGVPVPRAFDGVTTPAELRARLAEAREESAYVKLASGSSASCLAVYRRRAGRESLHTTIELGERASYNSLRIRRYDDPNAIERILSFLLREGSQVEASVPKARLDGRFFDCRVLVVAGEPAFTVIRRSAHPITNLHLGGSRGDPARLADVLPPELEAAAMQSCRTVAAAHPGLLHVGVDLMYEAGFRGHRVLEANAFGDLLPNLERDGLSVYRWEIRAALALGERATADDDQGM